MNTEKVKNFIYELIRPAASFTVKQDSRWNKPVYQWIRAYILLIAGSFISAAGINMFYLPFGFTMGGLSGIAAIVYYLTGGFLPFGTLTFLLNIPLLILGLREISLRFIWKSLVGTFAFSFAIDISDPFMRVWIKQLTTPINGQMPDPLLFGIVGGIVFGIGLGFIFRAGYTTGGTDILAVFFNRKFPNISLGQIILIIDVVIITMTLIVPHEGVTTSPVLLAMYSFISLFISTKALDIVISGLEFSRTAYIISDHSEVIGEAIMTNLQRGVTALKGRGMYTKTDKTVLLCVLSNREVAKLREIVSSVDNKAFVIVGEAREVYGEGFAGDKNLF